MVSPDQVVLVLTEWLAQPAAAMAVVALGPAAETYRPLVQAQVGPAGGPSLTRLVATGQVVHVGPVPYTPVGR
eukprot:7562365-Alexandrium_andersonii.AAC.2